MNNHVLAVTIVMSFVLSTSAANAQTAQEWIQIDDPDELRHLVVGRTMGDEYRMFLFRADGKMAYLWNDGHEEFISVREWIIDDNGALCMAVYLKPDRIIDCQTIHRTHRTPVQYQIAGKMGTFNVRFSEPERRLIDALAEKTEASE